MRKLKALALITSLLIADMSFAHPRGRGRCPRVVVHNVVRRAHHRPHNPVARLQRTVRRAVGVFHLPPVRRPVYHHPHVVLPVVVVPRVVVRPPLVMGPVVRAMRPVDHNLLMAAREGRARKVEKALKNGAFIQVMSHDGQTALHLAAQAGSAMCVDLLLRFGAQRHVLNAQQLTPAQVAMNHGFPGVAARLY